MFEVVSPTIDELQAITNSSSDKISIIFSLRSTGYVLGSIAGKADVSIIHFPLDCLFYPFINNNQLMEKSITY